MSDARTDTLMEDWRSDETRRGWVINSLSARIAELRAAERRCRKAFTQPFMAEPANHLADAYGNAALCLEAEAAVLRSLASKEPTS